MNRSAQLVGLIGLCGLSVWSLFIGVIDMSPLDILRDREAFSLLAISRFPRTAAVLISGASLAIVGAIMQMMVRNRFVEPMTSGTGSGAALGILWVSIVLPAAPLLVKMMLASLTALICTIGFLAIVRRLPPSQPLYVPLVGIIYGGVIGAGVTYFAYQADLLQYLDIWTNGEFSGVLKGRYEIIWIAALTALLAYFAADQFAIVGLGRDRSVNLGLNYEQVMLLGLIAISVVTALIVTTPGMIPFVGLVVPNIVSRLFGDNLRQTLPTVALFGATLVLLSDITGRLVRFPFEVPVGTIMGIVGAFVFLWLLYGRRA